MLKPQVVATGLVNAADLNGRRGTVTALPVDVGGRVTVCFAARGAGAATQTVSY